MKLHFAETQEEETDITIKQNKIFDNTIPYFIRLSKGLFILQLSNSRDAAAARSVSFSISLKNMEKNVDRT